MRIVIVTHRRENRPFDLYALGLVADLWREGGHVVEVVRGTRRRPPADLAIAHVDLTHVPREYADFVAGYPRSFNAHVTDISKRTISRQLVTRDDEWCGAVIVKTDLNSRGARELAVLGGLTPRDPWRLLPRAVSIRVRRRLMRPDSPFLRYQIFATKDDVPPHFWRDGRLVVERFLAERNGDEYRVRNALFLGTTAINTLFRSDDPIVRGRSMRDPEEQPMPPEVLELRRELSLDFGRIDYAIVDGRVVVYDVNKTPSLRARSPRALVIAARLAAGLDAP
jgi:hypothetical protein